MSTLQEQIDAAKLAEQQQEVSPLQAQIDAVKESKKTPGESLVQQAYKSMFPEWVRENTPVGAIANTVSGIPQAMVDTANLLPTIVEARSPFIKSGSFGRVPDIPVPAPESSTFGRTTAEWATPLPGSKFNKIADPLIGLGAGIGKELDGETGELLGGMGTTIATILRGKPPSELEKATEFMKSNLQDVTEETAIANIQKGIREGEIGTVSELAQDRGLMRAENLAARTGTRLADEVSDMTTKRQAQIVTDIEDELGYISGKRPIAEAKKAAKSRKSALEKTIAKQEEKVAGQGTVEYLEALFDEDAAKRVIATDKKPTEASAELFGTYSGADKQFQKTVEKPAWKAFDDGKKINTQPILDNLKTDLDKVMGSMQATDVTQKFGGVMGMIKSLGKNSEPRDIHYIVSEIKSINNAANKAGAFGPANASLATIGNSLEKSLVELGDGKLYEKAKAATKQRHDQFKPDRVGKARIKGEEETFASDLFKTKEAGAASANDILKSKSPYIIKKAQEYIKSVAKVDGIDESFMKNYDELLDRFPKLKTDLQSAKSAQDALVKAEDRVDEFVKTGAEQKKSLTKTLSQRSVSDFIKSPEITLDKLMKSDDLTELTKLQTDMSKVKGGTPKLKQAIRDRVMKTINKPNGKNPNVSLKSIEEFNNIKRNLIDTGLMSKDEVVKIEKLMERAELSGLRRTSGPARLDKAQEIMTDIGSSAAAIAALQVLPATNQLMLASTVKRIFKQKMGGTGADKKTLLALESLIKNPEMFLEGIASQKISSDEKLAGYIDKFIRNASKSVAEDNENE